MRWEGWTGRSSLNAKCPLWVVCGRVRFGWKADIDRRPRMREFPIVTWLSFQRVCAAALLISGCRSGDPEPSAREASLQQEMLEWTQANNRLAGPGKLKLRDGSCLDLTKLAPPWTIDRDAQAKDSVNGVIIATDGKIFGVRPFELKDETEDTFGVRYDGKLRVQVTGWSPPNPAWAVDWVARPERIEENRRSGLFHQLDIWHGDKGLEAYQGPGGRFYVDARRLTQCRDYLSLERDGFRQVNCTAISQDRSFAFSFRFDSRDVERLPPALAQIERAIGATRGRCDN